MMTSLVHFLYLLREEEKQFVVTFNRVWKNSIFISMVCIWWDRIVFAVAVVCLIISFHYSSLNGITNISQRRFELRKSSEFLLSEFWSIFGASELVVNFGSEWFDFSIPLKNVIFGTETIFWTCNLINKKKNEIFFIFTTVVAMVW